MSVTWEDLPAGLVDSFRQHAFSLNGEGVIIVRIEGKRFWVSSGGNFFAKLYDRLQALITSHTKADVVILTGRIDRQSGEKLSPQIQIREFTV